MSYRAWWSIIAVLLLMGVAFAVHDARRAAHAGASSVQEPASHPTTPDPTADAGTPAAVASTAQASAMVAAVDTLHAYFGVLFNQDRSRADQYWLEGRPAATGESDLRELTDVTGARLQNLPPEPLDATDDPGALRIPVHVRVGGQGPLRHYRGHYTMRRVGDDWRITSASIGPSPGPR